LHFSIQSYWRFFFFTKSAHNFFFVQYFDLSESFEIVDMVRIHEKSSKQTMNTIISIKGNLFLYYTGIVNGWTDGMIIIRGLSILCGALINQVLIRKWHKDYDLIHVLHND
jgi:hypothetical protein